MRIETIPKLIRDSQRFQQIVTTLAKYGLAPWLKKVPADWLQKNFRSADGQQICDLTPGAQLRLALTDLGTTFVKLGQILSTRPDLVGPEITTELAKLQSSAPADPPEVVRQTIENELGAAPEELFLEFDDRAAASASIGQVHFAKLKDGTDVVVKVQHPGIESKIRSDLEIMKGLAELAERYSDEAKQYRPVDTMAEFSRTLIAELDFSREQRNLERFNKNFEQQPDVHIPKPFSQLSTSRVLTMERLVGVSLANNDQLLEKGYDLNDLARRGADVFLEMIFRDGFYHADPHPGNIFALENAAIGLLDCGMVGRIDDKLREQFEDLLMAAADQDAAALTDAIRELGAVPKELDFNLLRSEIDEFLAEYASQNLNDFDLGGALNRMMEIIRRYKIILPARISLLIKVLVMLEGTARELSPKFNLAEIIQPYQAKIVRRRLSPGRLFKKAQRNIMDWNRLIEMAPREFAEILTQVKSGRFDVHLEHRKLDAVTNRLVLGILSAALFIGSSQMLSSGVPPLIRGVSVVGALGCVAAVYLGFRLVRAIQRSGNIISK